MKFVTRKTIFTFVFGIPFLVGSAEFAFAKKAIEIPIAHTPAWTLDGNTFQCGYKGAMPPPVLKDCTEKLSKNAVDLRGMWLNSSGFYTRIEQCGNRVTITGEGAIHDSYAAGDPAQGVYDVWTQNLPDCELLVGYAVFDKNSLIFYDVRRNKAGSRTPTTVRTLIDPDTIILNYRGTETIQKRVKDVKKTVAIGEKVSLQEDKVQ